MKTHLDMNIILLLCLRIGVNILSYSIWRLKFGHGWTETETKGSTRLFTCAMTTFNQFETCIQPKLLYSNPLVQLHYTELFQLFRQERRNSDEEMIII